MMRTASSWGLLCLSLLHCTLLLNRSKTATMALSSKVLCSSIPGLLPKQRKLCIRSPDVIVAISFGYHIGRKECQEQFKNYRWNCTSIRKHSGFNHLAVVGSRESAFLYAISSAGIVHAITEFCSRGNISSCGCDSSRSPRNPASSTWTWGGCSADVKYGLRMAKRFTDGRELEGDARTLMNLHNNKVGRQAVRKNTQTSCKCHGVSGSCSLKTCWRSLPPFKEIGNYLKRRYMNAKSVIAIKSKGKRSTKVEYLTLKRKDIKGLTPSKFDLIYIEQSPSYCEEDSERGLLGTSGRICNRTSKDEDGCDFMCCGRGYNTHVLHLQWQCRCKFHWCCNVECNTCLEQRDIHSCK